MNNNLAEFAAGGTVADSQIYTNAVFREMRDNLQKHFDEMCENKLFFTEADTDELWRIYLDILPNTIYRVNSFHDCTACRRWFRKMAHVIAVTPENKVITMWSGDTVPEYREVFEALDKYVREHSKIARAFVTSHREIGIETSYDEDEDGNPIRHDHFYTIIPTAFVRDGVKVGQIMSEYATNRQLLESSLDAISIDAIDTVLGLIQDNNLYRGGQWENSLKKFKNIKRSAPNYNSAAAVDANVLDRWFWIKSREAGEMVSRMKNHSIGVLLTDLTNGVDILDALKRYEDVTAPANYQRPKEVFTQSMVEQAKETIEELGYLDSLQRRYAVMEDLSINDVIYADRKVSKSLKDSDDLFDKLKDEAIVKPIKVDHIQAISLQEFIDDIVPEATDISIYASTSLMNNFVSLIGPENKDAPSMFQWDNPFCWSYKNNVADSMKQQVKAMGGDVDVDLRFSIRWNNLGGWDKSDYDAHCVVPGDEAKNVRTIYFSRMTNSMTGGYLDVDVIDPKEGVPAVENIRFKHKEQMRVGEYEFRVHCFNSGPGNSGFDAEIEFDGKIYHFSYHKPLKQSECIKVAKVEYKTDGSFEIKPILDGVSNNIENWNIKMNTFVPVNLICYSPNYWGSNRVGNKHVFFMIKDCISEDTPNAWYNEYLKSELKNENKRVMEALGRMAKVKESDNQLSGLGFATTKANEVTFKVVANNEEKIYKVIV